MFLGTMYQCARHISRDGSIWTLQPGIGHHSTPDDNVVSCPRGPRPRPPVTGGTIAKLSAEGHRVVLAVATDGIMGRRFR